MPTAPKQLDQKKKKALLEQDLEEIEKEIDECKTGIRKLDH